MATISDVEPIDPFSLGLKLPGPSVAGGQLPDPGAEPEYRFSRPCQDKTLPLPPATTRIRAHYNDLFPLHVTNRIGGFVANPRFRLLLNLDNVRQLNSILPAVEGIDLFTTIGTLNWRSIRAGGLLYQYTNGTPTLWLRHDNWTRTWGNMFKPPYTVGVSAGWSDWIHRCRVLIHEIEGHGTREYSQRLFERGQLPESPGHVADRFAMMSYQPYPGSNPFIPNQWPGYSWWGMNYTEWRGWQAMMGPPIWRD